MIKDPVFILGSHKSGTSLLRSLIDNHKKLFAFPRETHFFQYAGYWVDYGLRRSKPCKFDYDSLIKSFCKYIEAQNNAASSYSDNPYFCGYDLDRFVSHMKKKKPKARRNIFESYISALYFSLNGSELPQDIRIVEKSVENAEYAAILYHMFPESHFIHIVRNPYATLVSMRISKSQQGYPFMGIMANSLYNSYYYLFKNQIVIDRYLVIKYEDLLTEPLKTMKIIANFLCIDFEDTLLQPTFLGKPWKGNSTSDKFFHNLSKSPLKNWLDQINHYEIFLTNKIAEPVLDSYNYETLRTKISKILPVKGETLINYIKNRTFLSL